MTSDGVAFTTRPELRGQFGMVASSHWLASSAGMAVLERGGNAFDAAVASGFVLEVVEPHQNGPGGDLPALAFTAHDERVRVVCAQGSMPAAATPAAFTELGLDVIPGSGLLPAAVPGAVGGWLRLLAEFGTWRLRDVLDFAIGYAAGGHPVVPDLHAQLTTCEQLFRTRWTESARVFLPGDGVPAPGTMLTNADLAATFRRLLAEAEAGGGDRLAEIERARRAWYEGFVAEAIDRHASSDAVFDHTDAPHRGLLRGTDLAAWHASVEEPKSYDYHDWRVYKAGPWSQGPAFLQQLALLAGFELADLDPAGADFAHLVVECANLAMADREAWYADPLFADDLIAELLAPAYAESRRQLVGAAAVHEPRPGSPGGRKPRLPGYGRPAMGAGDARTAGPTDGDTVHVDVADRWGNLVSAMPSGGWLQSSPVVPGLGFPLGTRGQMFTLDAEHPNVVAPGKRPRTTLSPGLAVREDGTRLAFGSPGGDQQDQWALTFFVRLVATGWNLQRLIDLPMFHSRGFASSFFPHDFEPGRVHVEDRLGRAAIADLERRGHDVEVRPGWSLGRLTAVARDVSGRLRAGANPRGMEDYAVGR